MTSVVAQGDQYKAMDIYESLQPGDHVYIMERRKLAFCRVINVIRDKSRPDYTEYILDIVEQWYEHEYFETISVFLAGKRLRVGRQVGFAYSGMWQFYSAENFEKYYGRLPSQKFNRDQVKFENALRSIVIGVIALLLIIGGGYLIITAFPGR